MIETAKTDSLFDGLTNSANFSAETWKIINESWGKTKSAPKNISSAMKGNPCQTQKMLVTSSSTFFRSCRHECLFRAEWKAIFWLQTLWCQACFSVQKLPMVWMVFLWRLKFYRNEIMSSVSYVINSSLDLGYFPQVFKVAKIKPVIKNNSEDLASNYRPISLLPSVSNSAGERGFKPNCSLSCF